MNSQGIALHHRIVQVEGNFVSDMDGEKVMLSIQSGKYYNLGSVGGRIWELAATPIALQDIVDALVAEYEVDRAVCEQEVLAFVANLREENIIRLAEELSA